MTSVPSYDLIVGGTGFASTFFLHRFLAARPNAKVLVLERGDAKDYAHALRMANSIDFNSQQLIEKAGMPGKEWLFTVAMGGSSNCWWGQTPRFLAEDFKLKSRYGVGFDWPITYDDLESWYVEAEALMGIAGPEKTPYPMSKPYPQPQHKMSSFDRRMLNLVGVDNWVGVACARSSTGTPRRGKCCATGVCGLCPVDAKFRVMNEMSWLYQTSAITVKTRAEIRSLDIEGGLVRGVIYREGEAECRVRGDLVVLGLGAIFNPVILQRSGDTHPLLGKRLHEQLGVRINIDLANIDAFDGGTQITGLGYMFYGGEQRRKRGAGLIENHNAPVVLRTENGKWRKRAMLKLVVENLPEDRNHVSVHGDQVLVTFKGHSDYAVRAIDQISKELEELLAPIGLESYSVGGYEPTEGHIQGTVVMAANPSEGVVDRNLVHHKYRNLIVAGSSAFPSGPPANPSLTIAALSLLAANSITA